MDEQSANSPAPLDYRSSPARRAWAREVAEAYQIVLRVENGVYVGRGLELPDAIGRGATARACVRATREALVSAVEGLLEAGQAPPAPEFPASPSPMGKRRPRVVHWARNVMFFATGICVVATFAIAALGAKTVVFSGPTIAILGLAVILLGGLGRYGWAVGLGAGYLLICVVFLRWSLGSGCRRGRRTGRSSAWECLTRWRCSRRRSRPRVARRERNGRGSATGAGTCWWD